MVTNPITRDWTVTASAFATLNDMFGNRTVCGIGRGDSAVRVTGGKPTTLAALEQAMHVIKGLAEGQEVLLHGTKVAAVVRTAVCRVDGRLRAEGAGPGRQAGRRVHPATRRPLPDAVDGDPCGRPLEARRDELDHRVRGGPAASATTWRTPASSAAGSAACRQPRRRSGGPLRQRHRRGPSSSYIRTGRLRLLAPRARRTGTEFVQRIVDRFYLLGSAQAHWTSCRSCGTPVSTSSRSTPCTTRSTPLWRPTASR